MTYPPPPPDPYGGQPPHPPHRGGYPQQPSWYPQGVHGGPVQPPDQFGQANPYGGQPGYGPPPGHGGPPQPAYGQPPYGPPPGPPPRGRGPLPWVLAGVGVLVIGITVTLILVLTGGTSPKGVAEAFARALQSRDVDAINALVCDPDDRLDRRDVERDGPEDGPTDVKVVEVREEGETATVRLSAQVDGREQVAVMILGKRDDEWCVSSMRDG